MSPHERKQVTILSSTIGVVLIGGVFWVHSIISDPSQKPSPVAVTTPPTVVADNRASAPPPTTGTPASGGPATTGDAVPSNVQGKTTTPPDPKTAPPATGDPFRKVLAPDTPAGKDSISLADAQVKASNQANRRKPTVDYPMPPSEMSLPDARSQVKPFQPTEALNESFKLEGIVSNAKGPMAVITYGGTTVYVKQGETFGDGIHVDRIHRLFATFTHNKKVYRVDVGGGLQ